MSTQKITDDMTDEQKEYIRAKRREWQRTWRAKNKDKVREYSRRKRAKNPEKYRQKYNERYWKHRDELKAKALERWRAKHPVEEKPENPVEPAKPKRPYTKPTERRRNMENWDRTTKWKKQGNMTAQSKEERLRYESLQKKLVALERLYNIKQIEFEDYFRQRSILLQKINRMQRRAAGEINEGSNPTETYTTML